MKDNNIKLNKIDFRGHEIYVTYSRIRAHDRVDKLFYYDIKSDNKWYIPCSIEEYVLVNHWGTIVSKTNLNKLLIHDWMEKKRRTDLTEEEASSINEALGLEDYIKYEDILKEIQ